MDKVLLINKEKDYTSRDVVNILTKIFNTKKIGHFGTLDPLAEGLLIIGINSCTKLGNFLENDTKEYIAEVKVGIKTDTYDITGNTIEKKNIILTKEEIQEAIDKFPKKYLQEVPIYSAVKVKGKKLYEYARNNIKVTLPKKEVEIKSIELLDVKEDTFTFKCLVSKGTYIRSIINDLSKILNVPLTMSALTRTKQDKFKLEDAYTLEEVKQGKYKLLSPEEVISTNIEEIKKEEELKILNGSLLENNKRGRTLFKKDNKPVVLYDIYQKDKTKLKPYIFFNKED